MVPRGGSVSAYDSALLLSPVVSVWECIVRKMRKEKRERTAIGKCIHFEEFTQIVVEQRH
ncbi:hypothetical protein CFP56_007768 [Quercus suber]|uniref:Uncharacterized protein n=1 Tax=Quercus suber TaxID=58331 RepID=A0AAW0M6Z2_QUESU